MTPDSHRFVPPASINLTFLIQTENLARSVVASLGEFATRVSRSGGRLRVVTLDPIMHQGVTEILRDLPVRVESAPAASSTPFYLLSRLDQLRFLVSARAPLSRFLRGTDVLVIDADGAVQRMMRRSMHPDGRVILSIDALLYHFDPGRHSWWRRGLVHLSEAVGLDPYVPSATATSNLDGILVPHPSVAQAVRSAGARAPIQQVIFPRIEAALLESDGEAPPDWRAGLRLLYATGSYRWHRHADWDAMQRQELLDLCDLAESNPDLSIRIRRHPREEEEEYRRLVLPDNVTLSGPEIPSLSDLRCVA